MRKGFGCRKWTALTSQSLLSALILSVLAKKSLHGYSLLDELKEMGIDTSLIHHTVIYRLLRFMEVNGLVKSEWETGGTGPARRIYMITELGIEYLKDWYMKVKDDLNIMEKIMKNIEESILKGGE